MDNKISNKMDNKMNNNYKKKGMIVFYVNLIYLMNMLREKHKQTVYFINFLYENYLKYN